MIRSCAGMYPVIERMVPWSGYCCMGTLRSQFICGRRGEEQDIVITGNQISHMLPERGDEKIYMDLMRRQSEIEAACSSCEPARSYPPIKKLFLEGDTVDRYAQCNALAVGNRCQNSTSISRDCMLYYTCMRARTGRGSVRALCDCAESVERGMGERRENSGKKGYKGMVIIAAMLIIIVAGAGYELLRVFGSNHTYTDIQEYLGLKTEEQWALLINENVTGQYAYLEGETFYLPLACISETMDERLYIDQEQGAVLYALPEELAAARLDEHAYELGETHVDTDAPCLVKRGEEYYVSLEFLKTVSDCIGDVLTDNHVLWLWNQFDQAFSCAAVNKKGEKLRTVPSIRGEIVMDLDTDVCLYTLWQEGEFTYCIAENGLMGYVRTKELGEMADVMKQREKEPYVYTSIQMEGMVRMGWHQMDEYNYMDQAGRLQELVNTAEGLNVISPTWYSIAGEDGSVTSLASADYVQKAHELGVQVWALIDNFNPNVNNFALLSSYAARTKLIERLVSDAGALGFDGINVDFEAAASGLGGMDKSCGPHFTQFLRELSIHCRRAGLVLSVDNYVPAAYNQYYNRAEQGKIVDYVILMGYDEHYAGSDQSGSVASYTFVKQGIEQTLQDVPGEKLICAVPFYTRVWNVSEDGAVLGSEAKSVNAMEQFLAEQDLTVIWRETERQNYIEYELEGKRYQVWLEDEASLLWKLDLIRQYQLAGISCWKLGMEPDAFWEQISEKLADE